MTQDQEFFSFPHVVALGRRKMVLPPASTSKPRREWEVYVRLLSGSSFAMASGISKHSAGRTLERLAREVAEQSGCTFITLPDACVPLEHIARVYVDRQVDEHVTLVEDSAGATYEAERGSKTRCENAVQIIAGTVLQYMASKEME